MTDRGAVRPQHLEAIAGAARRPFWLDRAHAPEPTPSLVGDERADLVVVGGGYTGLWTALIAKERDPRRDVLLVEAGVVGGAASGRNGGFLEPSLTHGHANGLERFPDEFDLLEELGAANFAELLATLERHGIDADLEPVPMIDVALTTRPASFTDALKADAELLARRGHDVAWLDRDAMRAEVDSPTFAGGLLRRDPAAIVDPAKLAWGLADAARRLGVRIHEHTPVTGLDRTAHGVAVRTPFGVVQAAKVALATNAFAPLLRRIGPYLAPVYDYVLVTEPLTAEQQAAIGWAGRQGLSDAANQFHYFRLTADHRILWGGYDAIYFWRGTVRAEHDQRPATFALLAAQFAETFPQLDGIRFTHAWGGAIDTCSRFCVFWDTAWQRRVAYAVGYTGLGVGATRFGAEVMIDLLDGNDTPATRTRFVRTKPVPFPPEPIRYLGIQATRWSLDREDRTGHRNAWLRTLDRLGLGFDS